MIGAGLYLLGAFLLGAGVGVYCCGRAWKRNYDVLQLRCDGLEHERDRSIDRHRRHVSAQVARSKFRLLPGRQREGDGAA